MIERAKQSDIPRIVDMALKFVEAGGLPETTKEKMADFAEGLMANPQAFVAVSERGFIAGMLAPLFYNPDHIDAHELAWWSEDGRGLKLLSAFEAWADQSGAQQVVLSTEHTTDARAQKLLMRKGYELTEFSFRKAI